MKAPENAIVTQAMEWQRLSLPALASELGVTVEALMVKGIGGRLTNQLASMVKTPPEPLAAVADLPLEEQTQMREGLLSDVTQLANQRLTLEKDLATMRQQHEVAAKALNELREHVKGIKVVLRYAQYPQGDWKAVRPLEIELEAAVAANNGRARQTKSRKLAQVKAGLSYIERELLPEYEAKYETLPAVRKALTRLAEALQKQAEGLAEYCQQREALEAQAPLVIATSGQDLSLRTQQPNEAAAQVLAEEAVAACKAAGRKQIRKDQQERKAREAELVEETFDSLLPRLQAGENPSRPSLAPAALNPKLLKGNPATLLARQPRKAKPADGLLLPKGTRVKRPVLAEDEKQPSPSPAAKQPAAELSNATATAQGTPTETILPATSQPQADQEKGSPANIHIPTAPPSQDSGAPQEAQSIEKTEGDDDYFVDDGGRPEGWLMEVDEPIFQQYFGSQGSIFPSKVHRDNALANILEARLEEEERKRKQAEWERDFLEDPPD